MMPVPAEGAALQFFTEAMRANTATIDEFRREAREDRKLLTDIRERVIKIEAHDVVTKVSGLETRVDALEKEKDERNAERRLGNWMLEKTPSIAGIIVAAVAFILLWLKASGRM